MEGIRFLEVNVYYKQFIFILVDCINVNFSINNFNCTSNIDGNSYALTNDIMAYALICT